MTVIAMSRTEIDRAHVLRDMAAERITASEAAQLMRLTRRQVFRLARAYRERGPAALASTRERHGIHLGVETVRQWMLTDGLWRDCRQRMKPVHQPRYRRDCVGELVQIDGSEHWWFEGRGPAMHLARVHRRRDEPADASALCADRVDLRLF